MSFILKSCFLLIERVEKANPLSSCSILHPCRSFKPQFFHPSVHLPKQTLTIQTSISSSVYRTIFSPQSVDIQKAPSSPAHLFIHPLSHRFFFFFSNPFLSEVQTEGAKVASRFFCIYHGGGRDRDEDLVTSPQFKKSSLVNGV